MNVCCVDFLDSFEETKASEQEQLRTLESNIVTTLEHISEVREHCVCVCVEVEYCTESTEHEAIRTPPQCGAV